MPTSSLRIYGEQANVARTSLGDSADNYFQKGMKRYAMFLGGVSGVLELEFCRQKRGFAGSSGFFMLILKTLLGKFHFFLLYLNSQ